MDNAPRLIIIAEHDSCTSTQHWMSTIDILVKHIHHFPSTLLQIRAKTKPELRTHVLDALHLDNLQIRAQLSINATYIEAPLFSPLFIHLPQSQAPTSKPSSPFGLSIHHAKDPLVYDTLAPLYYQLGPIFPPLSKFGIPKGCSLITNTCLYTDTPIIAVGGITPENIGKTIHAGAHGVATSGYIMHAENPIASLEKLYICLKEHID